MKITENISEVLYLPIQSITDDRGLLIPFADDIDSRMIRRAYFVENYGRGVIRGLHYHRKEIKMFIMASGAAKFNVLKLPLEMAERNEAGEIQKYCRENPEALQSYVMSSRHHALLVVPPLYANGWVGLEDHSILFSLSNLVFEDARHDDIRIDPYLIGEDKWKVLGR